ncbi:MAG: TatD family hydrolase, partial [Syntrophales bacterium]|nr:TatD family hydrolase [Syntrophales bacterium]
YPMVYAAIGIHPHDAKEINDDTYDELKIMAEDKRVVALGEIGLDFFRNLSQRAVQIRRFEEQLQIASDLELPFIVHDREAHVETLSMLKSWKGKRGGVIHCFSGDVAMAETCLGMGFYISIAGRVTYNKSEKLREVVQMVPLDHLLIETDAPYLTPQPNRGKRNEPAFVVHTAKQVAAIRGISVEEVGKATSENARALFGIS